ncbi:hypothetical protein PRZ48_008885 [Zasmidium cellare]|uniref:F-box domain-containing protein n=1 Tax=Zasmidium cellare TaxID=395010 RepID=A0ABR0EHI0_ZASCE|nr:hypothetical protein PRZ48_008885 [Zasmidium cellare]
MAFTPRRFAEICNIRRPIFKLPNELRQTIYSMSQLDLPADEVFTVAFGTNKPLFEGFARQVSLLHVCRRFREELLPIFFAERHLCFLYDGVVSSVVPRGISLLPTDILQTAQSMLLEFQIALPKSVHGVQADLKTCVQVRLEGDQYDVDIHLNSNWEKCDQTKLLTFLGNALDDLEQNMQQAMGRNAVVEGTIAMHIVANGESIIVFFEDASTASEAALTPATTRTGSTMNLASSGYEHEFDATDDSIGDEALLDNPVEQPGADIAGVTATQGKRARIKKAFGGAKKGLKDMRMTLKEWIRL